VSAIGVKILTDAIAKILRLADVDYFALLVAVEVATGLSRQVGELLGELHFRNAGFVS
jgi:hypothetical protein